jgi:hypothetical protein
MTLSISVENQMDNVTDRRYSPWTRRRLPGAKLHVHAERPSDSVIFGYYAQPESSERLLAAMGNLPGGGLQLKREMRESFGET